MSDDLDASSNGANDAAQPDAGQETVTQEAQETAPATSAREAVERALAAEDRPTEPVARTEPEPTPTEAEGDQPRGPDGKFQAKGKKDEAPAEPEAKPEEPKDPEPKPEAQDIGPAPERFAKAAQEAWKDVPEPVRIEVERALTELTSGIEKYKTNAEAFEPVAHYAQMAEQSGTTLADALQNYVHIEQTLRQNPLNGIAMICQNMRLDRQKIAEALYKMQGMPVAPQPAAPQPDPKIDERFNSLESLIRSQAAQSAIDAFAAAHPHFAEVESDVTSMLETGYAKDLPDAYDKAIRLNPEIAAKVAADKPAPAETDTKHQPDPDQTRQKAALSPTGAPAGGSDPSPSKPSSSPREAVTKALASL